MVFCFGQLEIFSLCLILFVQADDDIDRKLEHGEKISLKVPQLSEEETKSVHMPDHLRCDACLAISYQMTELLDNADRQTAVTELRESEVVEIMETLCNTGFEEYGVKHMDGVNRLSGPGLEAETIRGMTQMGGRWPHRLREMCHYYVGEAGEMDIYQAFMEMKDLKYFLCYGKGIYGHCSSFVSLDKTEL